MADKNIEMSHYIPADNFELYHDMLVMSGFETQAELAKIQYEKQLNITNEFDN